MKIEPKEISIREVAENYVDDGDGGVYGLNGELVLRPPYQREFIYLQTQRNAVIDTVMSGFPLNLPPPLSPQKQRTAAALHLPVKN